jgi:hypothetical protein
MVRPVLGIALAAGVMRAVLAHRGRLRWAGEVPFSGPHEITEALGRLAAELPLAGATVRVVLGRDLIQLRTIAPAPPLAPAMARRYVALEAARLFRRNGAGLVTDARVIILPAGERVLWAAAAPAALVAALAQGCEEAGLRLEAIGPASEVLPWALAQRPSRGELAFPNGTACEVVSISPRGVWRSRLVRDTRSSGPDWTAALRETGAERAGALAAAYAATLRTPRLDLLPVETKAARARSGWRGVRRTALAGLGLWLLAASVHLLRLHAAQAVAERELRAMRPSVDSALAMRRELAAARAALATMRRVEEEGWMPLGILASLTRALGDSAFVAAVQLSADSSFRLIGYAPQGSRVLADLEKLAWLRAPRLEGPAIRERVGPGDRELDRFAIVGRIGGVP